MYRSLLKKKKTIIFYIVSDPAGSSLNFISMFAVFWQNDNTVLHDNNENYHNLGLPVYLEETDCSPVKSIVFFFAFFPLSVRYRGKS